jgi:RHS repeat-associated protein
MKKLLFFVPAILGLISENGFTLTHSRAYQWTFKAGNLLGNWSCENPLDFWSENLLTGFAVDSRFKAAGTEVGSAKTGSFVAKASGTNSSGAAYQPIRSTIFPIEPSMDYTLSFYYKSVGTLSGQIKPVVSWLSGMDTNFTSITPVAGLTASAGWKLFVFNFTLQSQSQYLRVAPVEFSNGASGTLYFDDFVLDKGSIDSNQVKTNRQNVSETVTFGDAFGRVHEVQTKITQSGDKYLVGGVGFDQYARPETTFLAVPYNTSTASFQSPLLSGAQNYYNAMGPFDAHGFPYSRVAYAQEVSPRVLTSSTPDSAWQMGLHNIKQDYYYVNDTLIPTDIQNPTALNTDCKYRLDWSQNQDSSYTLTWTNKLGQVVRRANNITKSTSGANTWKWTTIRYDYFPLGAVKKVYTPIDDSAGSTNFSEISQYDAQGNALSAYSPDRKLRKFWYNRSGQLRYSQDEEQRAAGEFTYYEYDPIGRILSQGIHVVASLPQDSVDQDSYNQGSKIEQIGYIYDDTATFQSRTGLSLQSIMGYWKVDVDIRNSPNRLFCKYNKNQDNTFAKFGSKDKFVADFFSYDERGLVQTSWKYIGAMRDSVKRLQDIWYSYDELGRMIGYSQYYSANEGDLSNYETFSYDFLGRVSSITGMNDKPLSTYTYSNWGPLSKVALGGTSLGDSTTTIEYFFHSQGGAREIRATSLTSKKVFQQFLGYENKSYTSTGIPALIQAKYDGSISQQTYKYTSDMNLVKPVRASNYGYDQLGRMKTAKAYLNTNAGPLDANEDIVASALTMAAADTLSTSMEYDLNGRITGQRSAGVSSVDSARYTYASNSYELDKVTGKVSTGPARDMSASGSFVYDNNGALLKDKSKKMSVVYGWDGLPVSFTVDSAAAKGVVRCCTYDVDMMPLFFKVKYPSYNLYNFYDADGNRVSRLEVESKPSLLLRSTHYVFMGPGMLKEWREDYYQAGRVKTSSAIASIIGRGTQIGRIRTDGKYDFYIKNHLGSTMLTVDDVGRYSTGDQRAMDYLAYGSYKDLKVGTEEKIRQKFTGKEFEDSTKLYAFGARWMDPELGSFISPDPAGQFFNPFSYAGGNAINLVDPNGLEAGSGDIELPQKTVVGHGGSQRQRAGASDRGHGGVGRSGKKVWTSREVEGIQGVVLLPPENDGFLDVDGFVDEMMALQGYVDLQDAYQQVENATSLIGSSPANIIASPGPSQAVSRKRNTEPYYGPSVTDVSPPVGSIHYTSQGTFTRVQNGSYLKIQPATGAVFANPIDPATIILAGALGAIRLGAAKGVVGLDANVLINGLEKGQMEAINATIAGRTPTVSITAAKEFLRGGGDVAALRELLSANGGRIGLAASSSEIAALRASASGMGRVLSTSDAAVAGSAIREGATLITNDARLLRFMNAAGYSAIGY